MLVPTKDQLKARSKHLAKLLQEKYGLKISHGHCLEIVAQLFGHKDWNTANAASPDENLPKAEPESRYTAWLEALTQGYHLGVEQPYLKEIFHAGGAMAEHSSERGVVSLKFTPRIDEERRQVILTLEQSNTVSTNDSVIGMHRQQYLQREKFFAEKLGGKAKDL